MFAFGRMDNEWTSRPKSAKQLNAMDEIVFPGVTKVMETFGRLIRH